MTDTATFATANYSLQPDQMLPAEKMTKEWYLENARFICYNYNPTVYTFGNLLQGGLMEGLDARWATRTTQFEAYYMGKQVNPSFSYMTRDEQNNPLPIKLYQDQTIPSLIKYMEGYMDQIINTLPTTIGAKAISSDIVNRVDIKRNIAKWKLDFAQFAEEMEGYGISFPEYKFKSEEDLNKYFEEDHKEFEEQLYEWLAVDTLYRNKWKDPFGFATHDAITNGWCMMKIYVQGGRVIYKRVPPWLAIWDNAVDSKQNLQGRFAGELGEISIPQAIQRWGSELTLEEKEELNAISRSSRYQGFLNGMLTQGTNLTWWPSVSTNQVPTVTFADVEWLSLKEVDGKYISTRRKATIIGNKFVVGYGEAENIIENQNNPSDTELSFRVCTPDISMGYPIGIAERLHKLVDMRSALMTKIFQLIARSKGKAFFINAANLPAGLRSPEVMADLSKMGVIVGNTADTDLPEGSTNGKVIEPIDLTLDPTVIGLLSVTAALKEEMEDIVNIPRGVRGAPKAYTSYKTAELNRAQSTQGIASFYQAIEDFYLNVISYAAETAKVMISKDKTFEGTLMVGEKGVKYINEEISDFSFAQLRIYGNFDDVVRQQEREEILQVALQAINAKALDFIDFVKLRGMKSARAMENYLDARMKQKEKEAAQMREQDLAMQEQQMGVNAQTQQGVADTQADATLQATAMKEEGATERTLIQEEGKLINQ